MVSDLEVPVQFGGCHPIKLTHFEDNKFKTNKLGEVQEPPNWIAHSSGSDTPYSWTLSNKILWGTLSPRLVGPLHPAFQHCHYWCAGCVCRLCVHISEKHCRMLLLRLFTIVVVGCLSSTPIIMHIFSCSQYLVWWRLSQSHLLFSCLFNQGLLLGYLGSMWA